jgi:thioredoxin-dependent peroxiredoxin
MLSVGTRAPEFTATLDDGSSFSLSDVRGKQNLVLYFYPKDFTGGCTKEACSFRDNYDAIQDYDAIIVGVSRDDEASHTSFKEKYSLPFPLIADTDRSLHTAYDVKGSLPFMLPRVTYVIDKEGIIRAALRHDVMIGRHVSEVLDALAAFETKKGAASAS